MSEIFINARFLTQEIAGVQRFAHEIVKQWQKQNWQTPAGNKLTLLSPKSAHSVQYGAFQKGCLKGHAWEQFELRRFCGTKSLINLCSTAPLYKKNQIVTIHDAAVYDHPQSFSKKFLSYYKFLLPKIAHTSSMVVTVSQYSKQRLQYHLKLDPKKIKVIHNAVSEDFKPVSEDEIERVKSKYCLEKPFMLSVGTIEPRKNYERLSKAWRKLNLNHMDLIICGNESKNFTSTDLAKSANLKVLNRVIDKDLIALYSAAECFIYPSLYEGFGIPLLEAMATQTPVLCSDIPAHREVCADAAIYFDPQSIDSIANAIKTFLNNSENRSGMIDKGVNRLQNYSWSQSAREYLQLADKLYTGGK